VTGRGDRLAPFPWPPPPRPRSGGPTTPLMLVLADRIVPGRTTLDRVVIVLPLLGALVVLAWVILALGVTVGGFGSGSLGLLDLLIGLQLTILPSVPFVLLGAAAWAWCRSPLAAGHCWSRRGAEPRADGR